MDKIEIIGSFLLIILIIMSLYSNDNELNSENEYLKIYKYHAHSDDYSNDIYHTHEDFNVVQNSSQSIVLKGNNKVIKNINCNMNLKIINNKVIINNLEIKDDNFKDYEFNNKIYKISKVVLKGCKAIVLKLNQRFVKVFTIN